MKRLMTLVLAALLSLGVASVSLAQEGQPAGDQPAATGATHGKAAKKHKKKHHKKSGKKSKKKHAPAAAEEVK